MEVARQQDNPRLASSRPVLEMSRSGALGSDLISATDREMIWGGRHGAFADALGRNLERAWRLGIADEQIMRMALDRVRRLRMREARGELNPFPLPQLTRGDTTLGIDLRGRPIRFPAQYLNGHSITIGGSGSGKTFKARGLVLEIAEKVKGLWCFDFVKQEFAPLKPRLAQMGINLLRVPARKIRLNPLQIPKHVFPSDWAPRIADVFVQTLQLPARATKLLHLKILELYHERDVMAGSQDFPTVFDLRHAVASDPDANHQAKSAIVDSIDPVLMSIGNVLAYRIGWTGLLAQRHIVFELGGVSEVDKDLLLNCLLLPEFVSRVAQGISNPDMDLLVVCDEAGRLVSSKNQGGAMADLISQIRGTGIGLDLSIQSVDVVNSVLSNTANKFVGRITNASDLDVIGRAMGIGSAERKWMSLNLTPGMFVGQFGEGDRRPFVYKVPRIHLDSVGNREEGTDDLEELMDLETVAADEFINWLPPKPAAKYRSPAPASEKDHSDAELRYIEAVINNPGTPSSALAKLARVGPQRAQKIRRRLVDLGYLREHSVSTGKRGRAAIVLEPLEPALQLARDARGEPA